MSRWLIQLSDEELRDLTLSAWMAAQWGAFDVLSRECIRRAAEAFNPADPDADVW